MNITNFNKLNKNINYLIHCWLIIDNDKLTKKKKLIKLKQLREVYYKSLYIQIKIWFILYQVVKFHSIIFKSE